MIVQNLKVQLIAIEKYFADTGGSKDPAARESFRKEASQIKTMIGGLTSEIEQLTRMFADARDSAGVGGPEEVAERDIKKQYKALVDQESQYLSSLRSKLGGSDGAEFDALATLHGRCSAVEGTVGGFNSRLDSEVDKKLAKVKTVLDEEHQLVSKYNTEIGEYKTQTDQVAGGITYLGFKKVAARFYEIVVRADVGIIDVAWALKDEKSKEVSRLVRQQKMDLKLLDDEFKEVLKKN